jgi:hypothetical protein
MRSVKSSPVSNAPIYIKMDRGTFVEDFNGIKIVYLTAEEERGLPSVKMIFHALH